MHFPCVGMKMRENATFWPLQPTELDLDFVTLLEVVVGTRAVISGLGELSYLSGGPRNVLAKMKV
jgi:hypothetical protein